YIGESLLLYGEFSRDETNDLVAMVDDKSVVLDVGANIGCLTLPLAKKAAKVYAFEPQRLPFQMLCANLAMNNIENVVALPHAVGAAPDRIRIEPIKWEGVFNSGGTPLAASVKGDLTDIITIDSLELERCDLIKVDVEGQEIDVLTGAEKTIRDFRPILFVEADRERFTPLLIELLKKYGYQPYWHITPLYSPQNHQGNQFNKWEGTVSINMLCIPHGRTVPFEISQVVEAIDGDTFTKLKQRMRE
ncbi:MAG: FkbM family methyltransferase, partial [Alphaproteobacteria bacterium]